MRSGDGREQLLEHKIKEIDNNFIKKVITNVSLYFKIPSPQLKEQYTFREITEMYVDILYEDKESK